MNTMVPPLLCRRPLLPGESLPSYLQRLAVANGYTPPLILARFCRQQLAQQGNHDNLEHPRQPATFALLAALTGCTPQELAAASSHCFAQSFILNSQATAPIHLADGTALRCLPSHTRARYLWPTQYAQFCPYCLQEAVYHRRIWLLRDVCGCVKHHCLLVNHCEDCGASVAIQDVAWGHCPQCNAPLTQMTTAAPPLSPLGLLAQQILQAWWGAQPVPIEHAEWALPEQTPSSLYYLFKLLRNSIEIRRGLDRYSATTLANQQLVQSLVFKALVNWPAGFYDFLQECLHYDVCWYSYRHGYTFSQPVYLYNSSSLTFWTCGLPHWEEFDFVRVALAPFLQAQNLQIVQVSGNMRLCVKVKPERAQLAHAIIFRDINLQQALVSRAPRTPDEG